MSAATRDLSLRLRGPRDSHAWQMRTAGVEGYFELETRAGLALDEHLRSGTRRRTGPRGPWFQTRLAARRPAFEVHLVGRGASQSCVRSVAIVPVAEQAELSDKGSVSQGNQRQQAHALGLERADEALDHRDAPLLANGAETLADVAALAPAPQTTADELRPLIAHQVLGRLTATGDSGFQQGGDLLRRWLRLVQGDAHDPSRVVIHDHCQPPAKRPAHGQRARQPGSPVAGRCLHGGEIDVPDVVGGAGSDAACLWRGLRLRRGGWRLLPAQPGHSRSTQMEPGAGQQLRDLDLAEPGTKRPDAARWREQSRE